MGTKLPIRAQQPTLLLDARAPLWVLTMGPSDPEHPALLSANGTYVLFDSCDAATRWAGENSIELYSREPFDWRLTGLSPSNPATQRIYKLLFAVCQVHAVYSDPQFRTYCGYYPVRTFYPDQMPKWPIVVSVDALINLSSMIGNTKLNAATSPVALENGDFARLDTLEATVTAVYKEYWNTLLQCKVSLTACQQASDAIWWRLQHNAKRKGGDKNG